METSGTDYGDVPAKVTWCSRLYWDGTSLYYFTRDYVIATDGRIDSFTAETKVTVDTTVGCS